MSLIKWNNSLSVNVGEIDKQHQKLVQLINQMHSAMREGKGEEIIGDIINKLIKYTLNHFKTEEKYFDKFNYPDSDAHKHEHQDFVKRVNEFKSGYEKGRLGLSIRILNFLSNWLRNHINGSDKKYTECFNKNGLK